MPATIDDVDIESLRREITQKRKAFKALHGREISKDDVKADPDFYAKYRLWQEYSKTSTVGAPPRASSSKSTAVEPTTPRPTKKATTKPKPNPSSSIFTKSVPTETSSDLITSNPFSPSKNRSRSPTKTHRPSRKDVDADTFGDMDNPFAARSSKASGTHIFASFTTTSSQQAANTPKRIRRDTSPSPITRDTQQELYAYADSPKKLRQLIQSTSTTLRDTPRTKNRKRLRGEDVSATPGDKRRRLTGGSSTSSGAGTDDDETLDDEDEEVAASPMKALATGPKGRPFKPLFDEDEPLTLMGPRLVPFFAGGKRPTAAERTTSRTESRLTKSLGAIRLGSSNLREASRSDESLASFDDAMLTSDGCTPSTLHQTERSSQGRSSLPKRSIDNMDTGDERSDPAGLHLADPVDAATVSHSVANPFGIRPPSPVLADSSKPKKKTKWIDKKKERVKGTATLSTTEEGLRGDDSDRDDVPAVVKDVQWRPWGSLIRDESPLRPERPQPGANQTSVADSETRYRERAVPLEISEGSSSDSEGLQVDLPDAIKQVLHIESPSRRSNRDTAQLVVQGSSSLSEGKRPDVWGIGEMESPNEEVEDDWDEDPEGWKGVVEM